MDLRNCQWLFICDFGIKPEITFVGNVFRHSMTMTTFTIMLSYGCLPECFVPIKRFSADIFNNPICESAQFLEQDEKSLTPIVAK